MAKRPDFIPQKLRVWIEARKRHRLSHAHIQMARELGMNPKKFGKLDNHRQEPWKAPLPIFIERLYFKRFGKTRPDEVMTIRQIVAAKEAKRQVRKLRREERRKPESAATTPTAKVTDLPQDFWEFDGDRDIPF
jgi:hypothetical protein